MTHWGLVGSLFQQIQYKEIGQILQSSTEKKYFYKKTLRRKCLTFGKEKMCLCVPVELQNMLGTESSSSSLGSSVPLFPGNCLGRTVEDAVTKVQPWSVLVQCAIEVIPWAGRDSVN